MFKMFEELITKDNALIYTNIAIVYLMYLPSPENATTSIIFLMLTFVPFIIISEIAASENFHIFLFNRLFAQLEFELRGANLKYDFYQLKENDKKEIDKIDRYFSKHIRKVCSLLLISIILAVLILLHFSNILSPKVFALQTLNIRIELVLAILLLLNLLFMSDNFGQLKKYMFTDVKNLYMRCKK